MNYEWEAPKKDPDSTLFYGTDWSAWLDEGETITGTPEVIGSDPALLIDQITQAAGVVRFRVRGGVAGVDYYATVRVTTSNGRVDDRTILYRVRER